MIYKNIKKCFEENKLFSVEMLYEYIKTRIKEDEIENFVSQINVGNGMDTLYEPSKKIISIDPNEILYDIENKKDPNLINLISKKERKSCIIDNPNNVNAYNLFSINHELTHALEEKIELDPNDFSIRKALILKDLIVSNLDILYYSSKNYTKYHDYFYKEYLANIESYLQVVYLLNSFNIDKLDELLYKINLIISRHILFCYRDIFNKRKISTPSFNVIKLYEYLVKNCEGEIPYCDFSLYKSKEKPKETLDRLRIGFSLREKDMKYLKDVSSKKIKTLNLFDDINN